MRALFLAVLLAALARASAFVVPMGGAFTQASAMARPSTARGLVMRTRVCDLTGKKANRKARVVTFSHKRIHKVQEVNLQVKKLFWEEGKRFVRMRLCTRALKTISKYGLGPAAKKYDVDLVPYTCGVMRTNA